LLHGYNPVFLPHQCGFADIESEVREDVLQMLNDDRSVAQVNIENSHAYNASLLDPHKRQADFPVNTLVLIQWPQVSDKKFDAAYKGPYVVLEKTGSVTYHVRNRDEPFDEHEVHVKNMKVYLERPTEDTVNTDVAEVQVSGSDSDCNVHVDSDSNVHVQPHTRPRRSRKQTQFFVAGK
jgi:hypothetical protein